MACIISTSGQICVPNRFSERVLKSQFGDELQGLESRLQAVLAPCRLKAGLQTEFQNTLSESMRRPPVPGRARMRERHHARRRAIAKPVRPEASDRGKGARQFTPHRGR